MPNNLVICCPDMQRATQNGTDNEGYGKALCFWEDEGTLRLGCVSANVKFCPFCGKKIKTERKQNVT